MEDLEACFEFVVPLNPFQDSGRLFLTRRPETRSGWRMCRATNATANQLQR